MDADRRSFLRQVSAVSTVGVISGCTADDSTTTGKTTTADDEWSPSSVTGNVSASEYNVEVLSHTFFSEYREEYAERVYGVKGKFRSKFDKEYRIKLVARFEDGNFLTNPLINSFYLSSDPIGNENTYTGMVAPGQKAKFEGHFQRDYYQLEEKDRSVEDIRSYEIFEAEFSNLID